MGYETSLPSIGAEARERWFARGWLVERWISSFSLPASPEIYCKAGTRSEFQASQSLNSNIELASDGKLRQQFVEDGIFELPAGKLL
jgi:hypothetical protein